MIRYSGSYVAWNHFMRNYNGECIIDECFGKTSKSACL